MYGILIGLTIVDVALNCALVFFTYRDSGYDPVITWMIVISVTVITAYAYQSYKIYKQLQGLKRYE
jgi:multisubunit Na+/H+ antiporter MnhC subunit